MTCTTCGRDNPGHLTFCQECGQRLGPRIAPPTPPIGLGPDPFGSGGHRPATAPLGATAPATDFKAGVFMPPSGSVAPPPPGDRRCKICDTVNGPNLRYCTSCGSTLDPAPGTSQAPAPPQAPVAPPPAPAAPIAPVPVVPLGVDPSKTLLDPQKTCPRCRGAVDPGAMFCKFCGNSLAEAKPDVTPSKAPEPPKPSAPDVLAHERLDLPKPGNGSLSPKPVPVKPSSLSPQPVAASNPIAPLKVSGASALAATPRAASAPPPPPVPAAPAAPAVAKEPSKAPPPPAPAAAPTRGRLVVIAKSGADGPSYPFGDLFDVGRTEGNVVVPEDPYLSPRHVRILWNAGKVILRDLGSTNGVYLRLAASRDPSPRRNDEIAIPLIDQDMILVGQQVLRFDVLKEGEGGLGPASEHGTLVFGSPAAPRYARLHQRTVEGITRDVYYIRKTETVLGRESGDVVFTEDPFLSRRHAAIRVLNKDANAPRFALVDLGSSNGTFIKTRADVELAPGDHFRVGQQLFRVDFDGASV